MKRWKGVAWDIDGTLIDSEPLHHAALLAVSRKYGLDLSDGAEERFTCVHMENVWRALEPHYPRSLTREQWLEDIVTYYCANSHTLMPIEDAAQVIKTFSAMGIAQICVSNSSRKVVDINIARLGVGRYLSGSISFDDVERGKPEPECYRHAIELLNLPPQSVLAVEDSTTGLAAARAAGLTTMAFLPRGGIPPNADYTISKLTDLLKRI